MATIIMLYEELHVPLKDDCATYVRVPEINIHIMMMRKKDMIIIKNLDTSPLYVEQGDFVNCVLDNVLHQTTVHDKAKIFLDCRKVAGVWIKNEEKDFIEIAYSTSPPTSPTHPSNKRKAEVYVDEIDRNVHQATGLK